MKRSTFLKSLLAIPVAVKALGKVEAKPTPRILKNLDQSKFYLHKGDYIIIGGVVVPVTEVKYEYHGCYDLKLQCDDNLPTGYFHQSFLNSESIQAHIIGMEMECYITNIEVSADEYKPVQLWVTVHATCPVIKAAVNGGYLVPPDLADAIKEAMSKYPG